MGNNTETRNNKRASYLCKCECGDVQYIRKCALKGGRSLQCSACARASNKREIIIGEKYGNWIVLECTSNCNIIKFNCSCICGQIKEIDSYSLRNNRSRLCRQCSGVKRRTPPFDTIWRRIVKGAESRDIKIEITKEYAYNLLIKQNYICALSGEVLILSKTNRELVKGCSTLSLDRINSQLGYIVDNIQWIHKDINKMKWDFDETYFINKCKLITEYQVNK